MRSARALGLWAAMALSVGLLASCGTTSKRIDPDMDDGIGGGGIESGDVRSVADQFSRDIMAWPRLFEHSDRPTIYFSELVNHTSTVIDRQIMLERITTAIVRNSGARIRFVDRSAEGMAAIQAERQAKREGAVTTGSGQRGLMGSDFVLKGTIRGIDKRRRDARSTYYMITMELTDLESGEMVWRHDYDFKWAGTRSAIYQ